MKRSARLPDGYAQARDGIHIDLVAIHSRRRVSFAPMKEPYTRARVAYYLPKVPRQNQSIAAKNDGDILCECPKFHVQTSLSTDRVGLGCLNHGANSSQALMSLLFRAVGQVSPSQCPAMPLVWTFVLLQIVEFSSLGFIADRPIHEERSVGYAVVGGPQSPCERYRLGHATGFQESD